MCDDADFAEEERYLAEQQKLSRRNFSGMAGAAAFLTALPATAVAEMLEAKQMARTSTVISKDVTIQTPDGIADCYFAYPERGKHPAVLIWPDIFGLRPAKKEMAIRLAASGYAVLVVNPYYRSVKAPVLPEGVDQRSPENFAKVREQAMKLSPATNVTDAKAFVAWLDATKRVNTKRKIGTQGYCMGGPMVLRTAAAVPERIGAVASFHGSSLANDKPESPHLLIPKTKASYLIAIAENDDQKNAAEKETLKTAFAAAKLPAEIEVYAGAMHGWCPPDSRVHNPEQAEKAWSRLLALYKKALP
jgi:carboxymethylenebutenolidase